MIDWDALERDLVGSYAARVRELRERFESELGSIDALPEIEAALSLAVERASGVRLERRAVPPPVPPPPAAYAATYAPPPPPPPPVYAPAPPPPVAVAADPWSAAPVAAAPPPPPPSAASPWDAAPAPPPPPPPPPPEAAPAAGNTAEAQLAGLVGVSSAIGRLRTPPSEEATTFLGLALGKFRELPDPAGDMGTKFLVKVVEKLDALAGELELLDASGGARTAAERAADDFAAFLERERGVKFFPARGESAEEARSRFGDGAVEGLAVPSQKPRGTVLRILERGVVGPGKLRRKARVVESAGREAPLGSLYLQAISLFPRLPPEAGADERGVSARELEKLAAKSLDASSEDEKAIVLRFGLNWLIPLDQGAVLGPALRQIREQLRGVGIYEIDLRLGDRFDESFAPDRYERRTVASERPPGTIVKIFQPGFTNRQGICIQKAIVGVAAGKAGAR